MTRYAQIIVVLCLQAGSAQDIGAGDFVEDAFDAVYSSYLDSLSYYMPDSLIKFFFSSDRSQPYQYESSERECPNTVNSGQSLILLLLTFALIALALGVLIMMMRSILREKVGRAEAKQLIHRKQSGFDIGLSFSQADRSDIAEDNENKEEEELDATPGHLHAVKNTADIALVSDGDARKRCYTQHSPSTSPLPFLEDILLDKSGLEDVPCPPSPEVQKEKLMSVETLNTVPERLCEDSLDDSHAFCDVPYQKAAQRKSLSSINECSDELEKSTSNGTNNNAMMRAQ